MICPKCRKNIGRGQKTITNITRYRKKRVRYVKRCPHCGRDIVKYYPERK